MYLKRLEIHGFKSFASKTTMEFGQGVIAIVGPNGSGKSNVADALRWVLGEQSAKMIRGKKSDDVIFAGSDKKARLGLAEVFATFDNSDRRIPLDTGEVSIGRRVDRNGESEYLLNGNKVRLLDIVDLVLKSNIGTSRYTVIGQGTIDQMVLQGPSGVKELIDEASGVKSYYIKRDKALRRLEQTANNLMRAEDLIAEIEPRLKSLRRQAKKMEARAQIEQELRVYQREFFGKTYWQLSDILKTFEEKLSGLNNQFSIIQTHSQAQRKLVEELETISQNQEFKILQDNLQKLQNQKNKLLEDLSLVRGKMQSQKTAGSLDAQSLQVELHNINRQILETENKIREGQQNQKNQEIIFLQNFKIQEEVSLKLNELYKQISNPINIDWHKVAGELQILENSWQQFLNLLQTENEISNIKNSADIFNQSLARFKTATQTLLLDPQTNAKNLKISLEKLLASKDQITKDVNEAQLNLSKSKISLDFLEKQLSQLSQEQLHFSLELKKASSQNIDEFWMNLTQEETRIQKELENLGGQILELEKNLKNYYNKEEQRQKDLRAAENNFRNIQDEISRIKDQQSAIQIEKAKYDNQLETLRQEAIYALGQEIWQNVQEQKIENFSENLEEKILKLKNQLDSIGGMDELTLKEYEETETRFNSLTSQVGDLHQGITDLKNIIEELDGHIKTKFNESFHKINEKFEFYFRILFNGGRAYLSVLKQEEQTKQSTPENEEEKNSADEMPETNLRPEEKLVKKYEQGASNIIGIDIKATPPGKKLASIQALSGGERALTSIALLCSLLTCFPSPFVVLDEVDAALDDANTIRFGQILGTLAHQTQFVTITHNRETMAQSHMIYGVTMGDDGVSKLLSVKFDQATQYAK